MNNFQPAAKPLPSAIRSNAKQPRHGHVFEPESRAMFAYQDGLIGETDISASEAGKFFPATEAGLKDPVAPTDDENGLPPLDGFIASAHWAANLLLDEPGDHWRKHDVRSGDTLTVKWGYHARHASRRWRYFMTHQHWDPQAKLARRQFESEPFQVVELTAQPHWDHHDALWPASPTEHQLILPERTGYQVLLAIWEVANTGAAFYQVIDLNFIGQGGGERPTAPTGLHAINREETRIRLGWSHAQSNIPLSYYDIYRDGVRMLRVPGPMEWVIDSGLAPSTDYEYYVVAVDVDGNVSPPSTTITVRTLGQEGGLTPPRELHSMSVTADAVELMWGAAGGSETVSHYSVLRDGQLIGTVPGRQTSFTDRSVEAEKRYTYVVIAHGDRGSQSPPSNFLVVQTPPAGDHEEWRLNQRYEVGSRVTYQGRMYACIQAHTSNSGWAPDVAFTLWQAMNLRR